MFQKKFTNKDLMLCIGGPLDGQLVPYRGNFTWVPLEPDPSGSLPFLKHSEAKNVRFKTKFYNFRYFEDKFDCYGFYVWQDLHEEDIGPLLIQSYIKGK